MPNAGVDLSRFRPADPDPQARTRGTHSGSAEALNIVNPVPGIHYAWMAKRYDEILSKTNEGWRVTPPESPARKGLELDPNVGAALDTTQARSDIILMEIPEEDYRRFKERKANRRRPPEATTEDYLASETLSQYGGPGRPIHFKAPGHSVRYEARPAGERSR